MSRSGWYIVIICGSLVRTASHRREAVSLHCDSAAKKRQQIDVQLLLMRHRESVRCTGVVDGLRAPDELLGFPGGVMDRNDLIVFAMEDQGRYVDLLQIIREVGLREGLDALVSIPQT